MIALLNLTLLFQLTPTAYLEFTNLQNSFSNFLTSPKPNQVGKDFLPHLIPPYNRWFKSLIEFIHD